MSCVEENGFWLVSTFDGRPSDAGQSRSERGKPGLCSVFWCQVWLQPREWRSRTNSGGRDSPLAGQRLEDQKAKGSPYFIGDSLTALDIYWAAFATLITPLPEEICPMGDMNRFMYTNTDATVQAAVNPLLMEHRDFMYKEHLELPVQL